MTVLRSKPNPELHRKVVDAMTTNETSFFRDIHPFDVLRKNLMPELIARHASKRQLSFWCGAASTGQEPSSVMMLLSEHFPEVLKWNFKFIATDLCARVLAQARAGRFNQIEINRGLPAPLLLKYFVKAGAEWEFRAELRKFIEYRELNLIKEWPLLPQFDVIFLRNVLIYFDIPTKKAILSNVKRHLAPGGYLVLGSAESTFNLDDTFDRVPFDKTAVYRSK
jgi:chemotaxis protein methyltransferase CheR